MPPKRKNKVTKTTATTPLKAPPTELASAQTKLGTLGAAKTSRLHPSAPLSMITRRAVKTASNRTSSGAPSIASSSSRRSSLNDVARFEDFHSESEDERSAKRNRLSTDSGSPQPSTTGSLADQVALNSRDASNDPKASSRKRRASVNSTESSKTVGASRANGVLTRTQSDTSEQPRRKKRRTIIQTPAEAADQPPELTDASTAPNSPEQIAEVETSQNLHHVLPTNGDAPTKMGRRLPGRRRAPHANINVEVDLRRQLNLKMSYRSLAKIQKNILEELSSRTTTSLDNDPEYHKQCLEYEPLMASLDQYREQRLAQVEALRSNKLEQLERVQVAEEHIAKEKYIREMKGEDGAGTEDEDNILPPTRFSFPILGDDDRVGSKYASRSRAYVETERLLDNELHRKRFDRARKQFVSMDEDADDFVEDGLAGFAAFTGPDRAGAVAHWNIASLIDAANNIESTPIPLPTPKVIPNEEADALFALASLSAEAPRGVIVSKELQPEAAASSDADGPQAPPTELSRKATPIDHPSGLHPTMLMPVEKESVDVPVMAPQAQVFEAQHMPMVGTNSKQLSKEKLLPKNDIPIRSTHRIMDMLNNDSDIPPSISRPSLAALSDKASADMSSHPTSFSQGAPPLRNGLPGLASIIHQHDSQPERITSTTAADILPSREAYPSPASTRAWPGVPPPKLPSHMQPMSLEELRRKDPLHMLREMLGSKTMVDGKSPLIQRPEIPESTQRERSQMTAPPLLSRPFSPGASEKLDKGKESRRASSAYNASPSAAPLSYQQSPSAAPAYLPRQSSQDPGPSPWERDRRLSSSQAPPPPTQHLNGSQTPQSTAQQLAVQSQAHAESPQQQAKAIPAHQMPFSAPKPQLPSISQSLTSKPSSGPINYRFAHYDPAPPRPAHHDPAPPRPVHHDPPRPVNQPQQSNYPPSYPSPHGRPPPLYASNYGPLYQGGYVPPPGSFQAPPPPPNASTPYPPLKIHQYGGQPILPANMAPPPPHSRPPSMTYAEADPQLTPYSPPQQHPLPQRNSSYDANAPREPSSERPPDPAMGPVRQPRRAYRSYHAPGSQFRPYNGPDSKRRGG
ncbi:hypothetical protein N0V90_011101 [Kalmusia sp. IMI 367209]|nr:hypothetical protein N0V90_011101 [Kalmusia sp. IMI 367209]